MAAIARLSFMVCPALLPLSRFQETSQCAALPISTDSALQRAGSLKLRAVATFLAMIAKVPPGSGLFEMWDIEERNNDRNVLDHGASGAAIVDCSGHRPVSE
jgi:hypothetical protein